MTGQKKGFRASQNIITQQVQQCFKGELDQSTSVLSTSRNTLTRRDYHNIRSQLLQYFTNRPEICAFIHNQEAYTLYRQGNYAGALKEFRAVISNLNKRITEDINTLSLFTSRLAAGYLMSARCRMETNRKEDTKVYTKALQEVCTSMSYQKSSDGLFLKTSLKAMLSGDHACTVDDEKDWQDLVEEKYPWLSREMQLHFYQVFYETYMNSRQLEAAYEYVIKGCRLDSEYFFEKMEHFRKDLRGRLFYQESVPVLYA